MLGYPGICCHIPAIQDHTGYDILNILSKHIGVLSKVIILSNLGIFDKLLLIVNMLQFCYSSIYFGVLSNFNH